MSKTFDQGKDEVARLCKYFETNRQSFLAPGVKEAHVRQSLIDPFFESLGWDVRNTGMAAPRYREVIPEDSLDVEGHQKAPDYTFRVGTLPKFYAEAKKCDVNIHADPSPAYQLRRYGWSGKVAVSILTDFEELSVYDCTFRPRPTDKASHARILYFAFEEYTDRWRVLWDVFSREAVWSGAFDQYAASKRKRGTSEVDVEFLKEIEGWREALARNIALRNKNLSPDDLPTAVQLTIDRVVFLRMAEDRGLEPYEQLLKLCERPDIYARFMRDLCRRADQKYNSGLFHFQKEAGISDPPDQITPDLKVDDKVLKPILQNLYFAHGSPYHFGVLPVEILGTVYERFLGKVIRLTTGHQAKIEEKPEVRKAGGVYYTPAYIVDYIVKQTVGKQIEGRSPAQLAGGKEKPTFRVLDMACGSGSFLLGAYQCLLDYYLKWYIDHKPEANKRAVYKDPRNDQWRLTIEEKKRILITHIFGVDIDAQAVEVTKLSLLLKVLEGETDQSINLGLLPFSDRALPNLADNIKRGNSLIGTDYFSGKLIPNPDEMKRVNPFDWNVAFPVAMTAGGFDCVIGNPPYRRELDYKELMDEIAKTPIGTKYRSPRMDLWYYFVHRGLELTKPSGLLSYIVNAYWVSGTGAEKIISALRDSAYIEEIFFLGKLKVFQNVSGQHMIIRVRNAHNNVAPTLIKFAEGEIALTAESVVTGRLPVKTFRKTHQQLFRNEKVDIQPLSGDLLAKIENFVPLETVGIIRQGIAENPASINRKTNEKYGNKHVIGQGVFALRPDELKKLRLPSKEMKLVRPYHHLKDLGRYYLASEPSLFLIYSTRNTCPEIQKFPNLFKHLTKFKPIMQERRETRKGVNSWWHLHWPRDESLWMSPKVISIQMGARPSFTISTTPVYVPFSVNVFVPNSTTEEKLNYILGILNSKVIWQWYKHHAKRRGVGLEINGNVLSRTPFRRIKFSDPDDKAAHDRIVILVEAMISLQKHLASVKSEAQKDIIHRQIAATDAVIDRLVYDLYGLTAEEIAIVEGEA